MIKHMRASIEDLLNQSTKILGKLLEMPGKEARKQLKARLAAGEKYIPCGDCDGFDPVHGCPGHPKVNGREITIKDGLGFYNIHMPGYTFTVWSVQPEANTLTVVIINQKAPFEERLETDWNLQHTQWAFEKGEYYIEKEVKP